MRKALLFLIFLFFLLPWPGEGKGKIVPVFTLEGTINPVSSRMLDEALKIAQKKDAPFLILRIDTPGGLDSSMREMVKSILNSSLPVVAYVSPRGARAASAGFFVTLASHIAAMAPGTSIGAAHPVSLGEGMDEETKKKVLNDAVSYARSIATERGRNVKWAEKAVRESASLTADEAVKLGVIDFVAGDEEELLEKLEGRKVKTSRGEMVLLTREVKLEPIPHSFREKILQTLSNPNLAYILLMIGIWGILLEFFHPGIILPGTVGAICLLLAFFSLQVIPFTLSGLLLILLALVLFILETQIPSYGILTLGGIASLTIGSLILVEPSSLYISISLKYIVTGVAITSLIFIFILIFAIKIQFRKPVTGLEAMVGEKGVARTKLSPQRWGKVQVHGELWNAQSVEGEIKKGEEVEVIQVEGMKLKVKPSRRE